MAGEKSWTRSSVAGGTVGVFAGGLVILLLEAVGHRLFGTADPTDFSSMTTTMFGWVLLAWVVGSAVAAGLATYWARSGTVVLGTIVGLFLLAGSITNFVAFPHPVWMMVAAVILMPAAAVLSARHFATSST